MKQSLLNKLDGIILSWIQSVDGKHAVIQIRDGTAKILDLYSKFGTFLNGHRINGLAEETITTTASLRFGEVAAKMQFCSAEEVRCKLYGTIFIPEPVRYGRTILKNRFFEFGWYLACM